MSTPVSFLEEFHVRNVIMHSNPHLKKSTLQFEAIAKFKTFFPMQVEYYLESRLFAFLTIPTQMCDNFVSELEDLEKWPFAERYLTIH